MLLRQKQNIMVAAMYVAFGWFWLLQIYYYIRWGFLLRENERITGPVAQPNPSGVGPVDVDPQDGHRWHNPVFRNIFTIHFANNMCLIAMALMYAPFDFEIVIEWIWLGFMLVYLIFYPLQRCLVLYKFADIGMHAMNITLIISGLVQVGKKSFP